MPFPDYEQIRDHGGQFESLAAYIPNIPVVVEIDQKPQRLWAHAVTLNYFPVLQAATALGRAIGREDQNGAPVAVVSHRTWKIRFAGDPQIIGRGIRLNGKLVTIVGVASPDFRGASPMLQVADFWLPVTLGATVLPELSDGVLEKRVAAFQLVGRLKPGIGRRQAEIALDAQIRNIEKQTGDPNARNEGLRARLVHGGRFFPVHDDDLGITLGLPLSLTGLMLWIACANVATMVLAKALTRRKEIGIRLSLGASRARLVRQLLTESMLLAVAGGLWEWCGRNGPRVL